MSSALLFIIGLALGSFLNVLSCRYDPDRPIFKGTSLLGRSHCPHCKKQLCWYELIPVVSFLLQRGRCRACHVRLSLQYPLIEIFAGVLLAAIPARLSSLYIFELGVSGIPFWFISISIIYVALALTLLFLSAVDARLKLIPDQSNALIGLLGIASIAAVIFFNIPDKSFLAHYSLLFGLEGRIILRHAVGALFGVGFFGAIVLLTRGRGMGMGDVKLAGALGLLFGWPDIALVSFLAFLLGSIFGILVLIRGTETMKSAVPFGPFIALAAGAVFFCGEVFMRWYFTLFP